MAAEERKNPSVKKHDVTGYSRGCRCDVCRAAKRSYNQEQHRKRLAAAEAGEANFEHGYDGYTRWGCRCEACKSAKSAYQSGRGRGADQNGYMQNYRRSRRAALAKGEIEVKHGLTGYTNDGCRCETCAESFRVYRAANPEKRYHVRHPEEAADANRRNVTKWQAETLEGATRYGMEWTGPELEIAARSDLTAREAALMIGRTYASVKTMRKKLAADPKTIQLAGIPREPLGSDGNEERGE